MTDHDTLNEPLANEPMAPLEREECTSCKDKDKLLKNYESKIDRLTRQVNYPRSINKKLSEMSKPFSLRDIKTDEKMKFYTGLESICYFKRYSNFWNLLFQRLPIGVVQKRFCLQKS